MRKSEPSPVDETDEFDPELNLALAPSWWQLGKRFAAVLNSEDGERNQVLEEWTAATRRQLEEDGMNEPIGGITPETVMDFVTTVMDVLERKFDGKSIAKEVVSRTRKANKINVYDDGQYLNIQEPSDTFWAVEYDFVFSRLDRSMASGGWLNAVARCADLDCKQFFVKARKDQRYHTSECSMRARQREAYNKKKGSGSHTRRGRPRLRR
ncbi:MAG TPA: hypothetical protein VGU66_09060 [Candidatus Elarobacter sp.]|nr:hypothetical protein [Candidatus Elarobacter sp.]